MRPSFGTNLPQTVTYICQKAIFKHALVKHQFVYRDKLVALVLQLIHNLKGCGYGRLVLVVHQYNIVFFYFGADVFHDAGDIAAAPVQGINGPEHGKHIQLLLKFLIPASIRRPDKDRIFSGHLFDHLVGFYDLFLEFLLVSAGELGVAVGMIADQVACLCQGDDTNFKNFGKIYILLLPIKIVPHGFSFTCIDIFAVIFITFRLL